MNNIVTHDFNPVFNKESKILILGTMPSPKSRENGFYYSHPQNKFWKILSEILASPLPTNNEEKKTLLLQNKIALWDVLYSCKIKGADDSSIEDPVVNDFSVILNQADIKAIFTTGRKATSLYEKFCLDKTNGKESIYLPSTSPANCSHFTYSDFIKAYSAILDYLDI